MSILQINKENLIGLLSIVSGVLIFVGLIGLPSIGKLIEDYPLLTIVAGFFIFFNRKKVAGWVVR